MRNFQFLRQKQNILVLKYLHFVGHVDRRERRQPQPLNLGTSILGVSSSVPFLCVECRGV